MSPRLPGRGELSRAPGRFKRALQTSRGERSFRFAHVLRLFEIDTPLPIACGVRKIGPFSAEAFYVSAEVSGIALPTYLAGDAPLTEA